MSHTLSVIQSSTDGRCVREVHVGLELFPVVAWRILTESGRCAVLQKFMLTSKSPPVTAEVLDQALLPVAA